MNAFNLYGKPD